MISASGVWRQLLARLRAYWLSGVLLGGLAVWGLALGANPRRGNDFRIYLTAARRFLLAQPLYPVSDGAMPFKYAPATAWLFAPFLAIPERAASALWNVLSVAALALSLVLMIRWLDRGQERQLAPRAAVLALLTLIQPLFFELFYGQVDVLILALLITCAVCLEAGRERRAGALWMLAVLLKPTALVVGLCFLLRRAWRALAWAGMTGALVSLPLAFRFGASGGWAQVRAWLATVERTTAPWVLGYNPQGLPSLLLGPFYAPDAVPSPSALRVASLAALLLSAAALWLARRDFRTLFALGCFAAAFASPLAWRANFVLALPMLLVLFTAPGRRLRRAGWGLGLAIIALSGLLSAPVLGDVRLRALLFLRPFGVLFGAAFVLVLVAAARPAPATAAATAG